MNLLNHKVLLENSALEPEFTEDAKIVEAPQVSSNDVPQNGEIPVKTDGAIAQINLDNTIHTLKNDDISDLDDIEDRIKTDSIDDFDYMAESIIELSAGLENINILLENNVAKAHAAQYKLLSETSSNDINSELGALYETTLSSLWKSFIEALTKFIEKAKMKIQDICFSAIANFDLYGKWANKFDEALNNADKSAGDGSKKTISTYKWNRDKVFATTNFSRLHEYASTVIGRATTVEDMERKLATYKSNNYTSEDIYSYFIRKCFGLNVGYVYGSSNKGEMFNKIIYHIRGPKINKEISHSDVEEAISDLKSIKSNVMKYASRSKFAILNPEFDSMLREAKREMSAASSDKDNIKYKYYRARYSVLAKAQEVAFDIYHIKIRLIKEYASTCVSICKAYTSKTMNESIDFLSMNSEIAPNAVVLD